MSVANSVGVWVEDAVGDRHCVSFSAIQYEESAVRHARWWIRWMRRPSSHNRTGLLGERLPMRAVPCYPCRVVVERYYDPSARP